MTSAPLCDICVVGLGVMGANLARNFARNGLRVLAYNRSPQVAHDLAAEHPEAKFTVATTWEEVVAGLERPRRILLMVPAGGPVDAVLDALDPLLEEGDVVIDAGNSLFTETDARIARAAGRPWNFVGMGVSGGAQGALEGPSMMPGGEPQAWERLRPVLEAVAAKSEFGPCVTYCGRGSAGHFVKMVHNGIEYGDMQLIAESATLLRAGLGLDGAAVADTFGAWNRGDLDSYLIEITADIFRTPDPDVESGLLVDAILDRAGQKGTGRWTVKDSLDLGVAIPTIASAVDARVMSAGRDLRVAAQERLAPSRATLTGVTPEDIGQALFASKIASYTQGFAMLAAASAERDYGTDLAEIARIWTDGCIIRARFLGQIVEAFRSEPQPQLLVLAPDFAAAVLERLPAWRRVVAAAVTAGLPVPGLSASLAWFDTLTTARGSANVIQAQRDYFGSHTYERVDRPGEKFHTEWPRFGG
ncbi:NADP-dependent phosphogluconate dehydrogenase [Engelhardtia mirabilis]|uniref:6-phosphogluconate dehydrogenase, decarboxylating n=1 Tax=Engelhardtia mirabilis TaxID=2528011 RepID=A0A518BEE7_9BACT|nr:6-phosphogluconate dehydrogenase, decarboxylating [Planctomycetes bacterium Pla133]QDU99684.1 6-phosphogluconate dehydrogenase, decarboxylating [Planctomycetes bacterium Pla86]